MNTITKYVVLISLCLISTKMTAQDSIPSADKKQQVEELKRERERIEAEERAYLKTEVEAINQRLDENNITQAEADTLKKEAAKKHALNIENRIAIIDNKIELVNRNENYDVHKSARDYEGSFIKFGEVFTIGSNEPKRKSRRYDRRTTSDFVYAFGLNNTIIDGQGLDDSPYKIGGSGFIELGWGWKTRLLKESNAIRLKYGFSFQWNKLKPKDNLYFEQNDNETVLAEFPTDLSKSKFRVTNLVFPVHFEFGPSRKIERKSYFRYSTYKKFKIGLGGYGGFRIGTVQKLKYKEDGDRIKDKIKRNYNTSNFVYGLSGYVGIGTTSLYMKYDLNPLFKNQVVDQNNISLGLRIDLD